MLHWAAIAVVVLQLTVWEAIAQETPKALAAALARQRDAETLANLSAEGQVLYSRDRVKLDGYDYCSQAVSLAERGEFRASIRAASKALHLGLQNKNDDLVAVSKRDLAIAYSYAGDLDRAEQYANEALTHEAKNPQIVAGPAFKVLGDAAMRRGKAKEGIQYYERALAAASERFKPLVQISLANAYVAQRDLKAARAQYDRTPVPENAALAGQYRRGQANLLLAEGKPREALALFEQSLAEGDEGADSAYRRLWAQEGVARSQLALGDRAAAIRAYDAALALSDQVRARFRSEEFKTGLFGDMQQIFERAIQLKMEAGDASGAFELSERSRARALLDIVRERAGQPGTLIGAGARELGAIRSALKPDEVLVEYHSLDDRLLAWTLRTDGLKGRTLALPRDKLAAQVDEFRQSILERKPAALDHAAALHKALIEPLGLAAGERLLIVPHGPLHYLPFQALRSSGAYLIETNPVAVAPSATLAVQLRQRREETQGRLIAFGNPEIEPDLALPGSQREVENLAKLFKNRQVYLLREASKPRFHESATNAPILHVAAHAEVDSIDPLHSRILLAKVSEDSHFLEAREVYDMDFSRVSLVTLSACESGLGKIARGDEILGFTRSFLSAGASSLIVSLWPVADDSTELLMTTLYGELTKGADLQQAMQKAQVTVLKRREFAHPFFWAPFNVMGDWRQTFSG